jgi:hypothetical protein
MLFLHQARRVRDLDPAEVDRIARRLRTRSVRARRTIRWPALAMVGVLMVVGATVSLAMGGLRALPIVGTLLARQTQPGGETGSRPALKVSKKSASEPKPGQLMVPTPLPTAVIPEASAPPAASPALPIERRRPVQFVASPGTGAMVKSAGAPLVDRRESTRTLAWSAAKPSGKGGSASVPLLQPSPTTPPAEDPIVAESRSFASVIVLWRRDRDPGRALALLDGHDQRYPSGPLRAEAHILRAELYLSQGQRAEALSILDGMSLSRLPRARELLTVRGELRVETGRCAEARGDLGLVLEKDLSDSLSKRATQALSHCP